MYSQYDTPVPHQQAQRRLSHTMVDALHHFLAPVVCELEETLDARLVRTFVDTIIALIVFRDRAKNLLLSELGAFIATPGHAPAGTKRLSSLLRSSHWHACLPERFLWRQATSYVQALREQQHTPLVLWDESMVEKPESSQLEGLGSVRSSKARRLTRIKPGSYQPPKGTVFVPGMQ